MFILDLKNIQPINTWRPDSEGPKWDDGRRNKDAPKYLIDETTGNKYWNETKKIVRSKCFLLTLGTPFIQPIALLINAANKIVKLVSFYHFWKEIPLSDVFTNLTQVIRIGDTIEDLLRVAITPIAFVGLELAAIYGLFSPYDGRKLYASIEKAMYDDSFNLAPCFQPNPTCHLFCGNPQKRNAF